MRVLLLLLLLSVSVSAQFGQQKKAKAPVLKSDLPYLRCGVCVELAKNVARQAKTVRQEKGAKLREEHLLERLEKVCNPEAEAGEWIARLDVVERGSKLALEEQETVGKCDSECRTVARACEDVLGDSDTDVAERLFVDSTISRSALQNLLCTSLSSACVTPTPPLPASRPPGPPFIPKTEQEIKMDELMRTMGDIPGMPGMSMYSRDDLAGMTDSEEGDEEELGGFTDDEQDAEPPVKPFQRSQASKTAPKTARDGALARVSDGLREAMEVAADRAGQVMAAAGDALESAVEKGAQALSDAWEWAEKAGNKLRKKELRKAEL